MTEDEIRTNLTGVNTLALTIFGEARGEPIEGKIAVANVIRNRAHPVDEPHVKAVCLAPLQFSCWNPGVDPNHQRVLAQAEKVLTNAPLDAIYRECLFIAQGTVGGAFQDNTGGATNYLTTELLKSDRAPRWAAQMQPTVVIGAHSFLRNA
jgi:N-acetylmuramoyl-L-alanine amidase